MVASILIDGNKLVEARRRRYLTRAELAQRAELQIGTVQRVEQTGITSVAMKTLRKLAKGLSVEPDVLEKELRPADPAGARGEAVTPDMIDRLSKAAAVLGREPGELLVEFLTAVEGKAARKARPSRIKPRRRKMKTLDEHGKIIEHS